MTVQDPIAVLSELAQEAMRRLGDHFQVTVKGDYREFPLVLTITVEEYEGDAHAGYPPSTEI